MGIIAKEIERAKKQGDVQVAEFSGAQRSLDQIALEEGDVFVFPNSYDVWEQEIGGNKVQYIFVEMTDGTSAGQAKKFYPSTFTKVRSVYNENGTINTTAGRVHTLGTAADLFRSEASVQAGMDLLKGKKVRVSKIVSIRTLRYGTTSLMNAQIPTIDLINEQGQVIDKDGNVVA